MLLNCSPEAVAARQAELDKLVDAQNRLLSGRAPRVIVDQNGERLEFTQVNMAYLAKQILGLRQEQAMCGQVACGVQPYITKPINYVF